MPPNVAEYLIAQHVPDLFRRESRNVGVFVRMAGRVDALFLGEKEDGNIDDRTRRSLAAPDVYAQWVRYWRHTLSTKGEKAWDTIRRTARDNYQLVDGGTVDGIGGDSAADVARHLITVLVSPGGMAEAIGGIDEGEAAARLAEDVEAAFKRVNILDEGPNLFSRAKHPVIRDRPVKGKTTIHTLKFVQQNGHVVAMEPIDLAVRRDRRRVEERAGWASRVFGDIRDADKDAETIAIVSATEEQAADRSAVYALSMIRPYARVVNWQDPEQRRAFMAERSALAGVG